MTSESKRRALRATVVSFVVLMFATVCVAGVGVPAPHPWAAAGPYPMSHHNPGQTDLRG
jgi:hypothetical protein